MKNYRIIVYTIVIFIAAALPAALHRSDLFAMPLSGVYSIAVRAIRYDPGAGVDSVIEERMKRAYSPVLRVGFAAPSMLYMMDKDLKYYYNKSWGLMADCFFFRMRGALGNGFDIGARFTYRNFKIGDDVLKKKSDVLLYKDYKLHMASWDICFRGVVGAYFLHELWQFYIIAAPRLLYYRAIMKKNKLGDPDKTVNLVSIGVVAGGGVEVTLFSMMGLFAEYNIGYTPVGKSFNNVEGHQVYVGLTWRALGMGDSGY